MTAYSHDTAPQASSSGRVLSILAIVFGAIAAVLFPIVFGIAGIVCGAIAVNKDDRLGKLGLTIAIVGTVVGFVLGALVYGATN